MEKRLKLVFLTTTTFVLLAFTLSAQDSTAPDSTGLPGDNFSLEGAIELFKKAESPEDFEKLLNAEDNAVNNLDLNEDGQVDYIRVVDNMEGEAHAIVLQVSVSESEAQDVAVIQIEKKGEENAILQIIGDPNIYGKDVIVEPFEDEKPAKQKSGGPSFDAAPVRVVVNVWLWPSVRFIYRPGYTVWVSPWRWAYYPGWYRPWRPVAFGVFHVRIAPFRPHYHVVTYHRCTTAKKVYAPRRTSSKVVHTKTTTTVKTRKGTVTKTTKKTTVNTPKGNVTAKKSTTRVKKRGG